MHDRTVFYLFFKALDKLWGQAPYGWVCGQLMGPCNVHRAGCVTLAVRVEAQLGVLWKIEYLSVSHNPFQVCSIDVQSSELISLDCVGYAQVSI